MKLKKVNLKKVGKVLVKGAKDNAPKILTCLSIVSGISAGIATYKLSPKAHEVIKEVKENLPEGTSKPKEILEEVVAVAPIMWPPVAMGALSVGCVLGSYKSSAKRTAAAMAAYSISEQKLSEYKNKVVETIGEKQEKEISNSISQDKVNKSKNEAENFSPIMLNDGTQIIYDIPSDRFLYAKVDDIKEARDFINRKVKDGDGEFVSVNDFYDELGWKRIRWAEDQGWQSFSPNNSVDLMQIRFNTCFYKDTYTSCVTIDYDFKPRYEERYNR